MTIKLNYDPDRLLSYRRKLLDEARKNAVRDVKETKKGFLARMKFLKEQQAHYYPTRYTAYKVVHQFYDELWKDILKSIKKHRAS